jgi:hypothetical protein
LGQVECSGGSVRLSHTPTKRVVLNEAYWLSDQDGEASPENTLETQFSREVEIISAHYRSVVEERWVLGFAPLLRGSLLYRLEWAGLGVGVGVDCLQSSISALLE